MRLSLVRLHPSSDVIPGQPPIIIDCLVYSPVSEEADDAEHLLVKFGRVRITRPNAKHHRCYSNPWHVELGTIKSPRKKIATETALLKEVGVVIGIGL